MANNVPGGINVSLPYLYPEGDETYIFNGSNTNRIVKEMRLELGLKSVTLDYISDDLIENIKDQINIAVTLGEIPDGSITEPKYATGSVSTRALANGSVTAEKLAVSITPTITLGSRGYQMINEGNGSSLSYYVITKTDFSTPSGYDIIPTGPIDYLGITPWNTTGSLSSNSPFPTAKADRIFKFPSASRSTIQVSGGEVVECHFYIVGDPLDPQANTCFLIYPTDDTSIGLLRLIGGVGFSMIARPRSQEFLRSGNTGVSSYNNGNDLSLYAAFYIRQGLVIPNQNFTVGVVALTYSQQAAFQNEGQYMRYRLCNGITKIAGTY